MLITNLVEAFEAMPRQAGQHGSCIILRGSTITTHFFLCQDCGGCSNASWPQQIKWDRRIPALCRAYICLSVFVISDLHCFRSGGRWLRFCCCQLEDVLLQRGATMHCCRNGSQYLSLQCCLSLFFIPPWARKKSCRSKKWHSAVANGAGELVGSFMVNW